MKCNNIHCYLNYSGNCCHESEEAYNQAEPNELDCPSSLRRDFENQFWLLLDEIYEQLRHRNFRELIEIKKYIESQREKENLK